MLQATVRIVLAATAICALSRAAVIYEFSGIVNMVGATEMFGYTSPAFIAADTFVPESALDSCSTGQVLPCFGINFLPSGPDTPQHYPELTFQIRNPDNSVGTVFYYFPLGSSFAEYGTLNNIPSLGNTGTLMISAAVPEPSNGWAVILGLLVLVVVRRSFWIAQRKEIRCTNQYRSAEQCGRRENQRPAT